MENKKLKPIFRLGPKISEFNDESFSDFSDTIILDGFPIQGDIICLQGDPVCCGLEDDEMIGEISDTYKEGAICLVVRSSINLYGSVWLAQIIVSPFYSGQNSGEGRVWRAQGDYLGNGVISKEDLRSLIKPKIIRFLGSKENMGRHISFHKMGEAIGFSMSEFGGVLIEMEKAGELEVIDTYEPVEHTRTDRKWRLKEK